MMPLLLDSEAARDIVAKAEAHNGHLLLVLQRDPERPPRGLEDLHEVGVVTRILRTLKLPDGGMSAMTQGLRRAKVHKLVRQKPHMVVRIKEAVEIPAQGPRAESLFRLLQKQLRQLAEVQDQVDTGFATALLNVEDPGQLADFTGGIVRKVEDRQRLLDAVERVFRQATGFKAMALQSIDLVQRPCAENPEADIFRLRLAGDGAQRCRNTAGELRRLLVLVRQQQIDGVGAAAFGR